MKGSLPDQLKESPTAGGTLEAAWFAAQKRPIQRERRAWSRAPGLSSFKYSLPSILAPEPHASRDMCGGSAPEQMLSSRFIPTICSLFVNPTQVGMPAGSLPTGQRRQGHFWGFTGCKTEAQKRSSHAKYNSFDMPCMRNQVKLLYFPSPSRQVSSSLWKTHTLCLNPHLSTMFWCVARL